MAKVASQLSLHSATVLAVKGVRRVPEFELEEEDIRSLESIRPHVPARQAPRVFIRQTQTTQGKKCTINVTVGNSTVSKEIDCERAARIIAKAKGQS